MTCSGWTHWTKVTQPCHNHRFAVARPLLYTGLFLSGTAGPGYTYGVPSWRADVGRRPCLSMNVAGEKGYLSFPPRPDTLPDVR